VQHKSLKQLRINLQRKLNFVHSTTELLEKSCSQTKERSTLKSESPEDFKKKCEIANEFISIIRHKKQKHEQQRMQRERIIMTEKKPKEKEQLEHQKELMKENQRKKSYELYRKLQRDRELQHIKWKQVKHNVVPKNNSYLYKRYEDKYQKEVEGSLFERKQSELIRRKEFLKAITTQELDEHKQKCEKIIQEREKEKMKELKSRKEVEKALVEQQKKYKTKISQEIKYLDEKQKEEEEIRLRERDNLLKKRASYSELLKDTHKIKTSLQKAFELKKLISKLKHPVRKPKPIFDNYLPKTKTRNRATIQLGSLSIGTKPHINYLPELRKQRLEHYKAQSIVKHNWNEDLANMGLNREEKVSRVMLKANIMEKCVKVQEELMLKAKGPNEYITEENKAAEFLLSAINAKLAVLNEFNVI